MSRIAVFAYGSLVSRPSAEATLARPVGELVPVRLPGWRRSWSLIRDNARCEKTFATAGGSVPEWIISLNLEPAPRRLPDPTGALIELTADELTALDRRELRYDRIEITDHLVDEHPFSSVYTYSAKPEHHAPEAPDGAVILASYVEAVEAGFAALGAGALDAYRSSTLPMPVPVIDGHLVADRIPEGNPREW